MRGVLQVSARRWFGAGGHAQKAASGGAKKQVGSAVLDMGTDAEQATGLEKRELDALAKGETLFGEDILYGAFGTPEKPVIVRSVFDSRIVGCVGHAGHEHDLIWHVVSNGKPLVCLECGQVFKLEKIDDPLLHSHH